MSNNQTKRYEQEILFYHSLNGEEKRLFFVDFFVSEIVLSLVNKRKENKISQTQLAKCMKVKQSYISKVENLEKIPTLETIAKYYFGLTEILTTVNNENFAFCKNFVEATFMFEELLEKKSNIFFNGMSQWGVNYNSESKKQENKFVLCK